MNTSITKVSALLRDRHNRAWLSDLACLHAYCVGYDLVTSKVCPEVPVTHTASRFFSETAERLRVEYRIQQTIALSSIYYGLGGREEAWTLFAGDWSRWVLSCDVATEFTVAKGRSNVQVTEIADGLRKRPQMLIGVASVWRAEGLIRGILDALTEANLVDGTEFLNRMVQRIRKQSALEWSNVSDPFVLASVQSGFNDSRSLEMIANVFGDVAAEYPMLTQE